MSVEAYRHSNLVIQPNEARQTRGDQENAQSGRKTRSRVPRPLKGRLGAIRRPIRTRALAEPGLQPTGDDRLGVKCPSCPTWRSEEHTSELQSLTKLVCRLLLEKKNT